MNTQAIFETRRKNLTQVIDQLIESQRFKTGKDICDFYGLPVSTIAQLMNSKRQIGEKTARELEQKLQLPALLLDQEEYEKNPNVEIKHLDRIYSMDIIQHDLFKLSPHSSNENVSVRSPLKPSQYLIQANSTYAPYIREHWFICCDENKTLKQGEWGCLVLKHDLHLILQYIHDDEKSIHFQSLDKIRKVSFQRSDIESFDVITAILHPDQIQQA